MHRTICAQLDRIVASEIDRLMLLCPPQHGKSTVASKRFPAFALGRNPRFDVISSSATAELAEEFGRDVRNCIGSIEYGTLFPKTQLSEDTTAKGRWKTTQGGGYFAVGVGGAIFGRGAHGGIIDDPFASWQDAQSEITRRDVWDWYRGSFYNRIRPGGWIILINHRMHQEDLSGRLIEEMRAGNGDKWEIVELPAELDNPPWAERYDRPALERLKGGMSPLMWSALYMQQPTPEQGTYFQKDWFERFDPKTLVGAYKYTSGDFAVTHEGGDWTDIATHGYRDGVLYLGLDYWYGKTTSDVWIDVLCEQFKRHRPFCFFGESGVIRRSIEPFLIRAMREQNCATRCEWLARPHDKPTMARGLQGLAAQGRVKVADTEGGERLLTSLLRFPTGKPDDPVDMAALMGMALDQAHPAISDPGPVKNTVVDGYLPVDREPEVDRWRVV